MQELEKNHKDFIETQAQENATKLKEATDEVATAAAAKADLDSQLTKLKEALASSSKEVETLKGKAQKPASP